MGIYTLHYNMILEDNFAGVILMTLVYWLSPDIKKTSVLIIPDKGMDFPRFRL